MRVGTDQHASRPWRIHELTSDFAVVDVWALPTPGGPEDFHLLIDDVGSGPPESGAGPIGRFVWAARWQLGKWFGWDEPTQRQRVGSLRDRLPADLRELPTGPELTNIPFSVVYRLSDEWAAEIINGTVHGVMHLSWIADDEDAPEAGHHGQMAVLVKPNGRLGSAYMAAIKPFRYLLIYPALMRQIERDWTRHAGRSSH